MIQTCFTKNIEKLTDNEFVQKYQYYININILAFIISQSNSRFAMFILSWFSANIIVDHMVQVQKVYKYLQSIKDLKFFYLRSFTKISCLKRFIVTDKTRDKKTQNFLSSHIAIFAKLLEWSSWKEHSHIVLSVQKTVDIRKVEVINKVI